MALVVKWTKRAERNFHQTVQYIESEWGARVAQKFVQRVNLFLKTLKDLPQIGKIEVKEKGIRAFVLSRHNTVFYRIKGKQIILLAIFDNRANPDKKPK